MSKNPVATGLKAKDLVNGKFCVPRACSVDLPASQDSISDHENAYTLLAETTRILWKAREWMHTINVAE